MVVVKYGGGGGYDCGRGRGHSIGSGHGLCVVAWRYVVVVVACGGSGMKEVVLSLPL